MSSILASLTLPTTRDRVIAEMGGRLNITSRLSRLAEQLGWAIRQSNPTAVDSDCLRNAANRLFYEQPELLPPQAPARQLSSEFHSFSRVFTGGFLDALNNMLAIAGAPTAQTLEGVAIDMGRLLVDGIMTAPVVPAYYSQVAASMIQAARTRNAGRYATAISSAFIERGLLSPQAVASLTTAPRPQPQMGDAGVGFAATSAEGSADAMLSYGPALSDGYAKGFADAPELPLRPIKGDGLGLQLLAHAAGETPLFDVASASTFGMMPLPERTAESSAEAFVEDLIQTGRLDISDVETPLSFASDQSERKTHKLVRTQNGVALKRLRFDCFGCCAVG
jgi:hypothetical protein